MEQPQPYSIEPMTVAAWIALARQRALRRERSWIDTSEGARCLYADPYGGGCFIGVAADRGTAEAWDCLGYGASLLLQRGYIGVSDLPPDRAEDFIDRLQRIHDGYETAQWEIEIDKLEAEFLRGSRCGS